MSREQYERASDLYSEQRENDISLRWKRSERYGDHLYCVEFVTGERALVTAQNFQIGPDGSLTFLGKGTTEHGQPPVLLAFPKGYWGEVYAASAMDNTAVAVVDDDRLWSAQKKQLERLRVVADAAEQVSVEREQDENGRARRRERSRITPSVRYAIFRRDSHTCQACGLTREAGAVLHVDHIVPIAAGGTSDIENLQTLCAPCNQGKGARQP